MSWFSRNAHGIEAAAALITACVAVAALVGVKLQLDAADALQRAQSARDAYRAHLALEVAHPAFAQPDTACALIDGPSGEAYRAFVDHLLYSAEQMLVIDPAWDATFLHQLEPHADLICSRDGPVADTDEIAALLSRFQASECGATPACAE